MNSQQTNHIVININDDQPRQSNSYFQANYKEILGKMFTKAQASYTSMQAFFQQKQDKIQTIIYIGCSTIMFAYFSWKIFELCSFMFNMGFDQSCKDLAVENISFDCIASLANDVMDGANNMHITLLEHLEETGGNLHEISTLLKKSGPYMGFIMNAILSACVQSVSNNVFVNRNLIDFIDKYSNKTGHIFSAFHSLLFSSTNSIVHQDDSMTIASVANTQQSFANQRVKPIHHRTFQAQSGKSFAQMHEAALPYFSCNPVTAISVNTTCVKQEQIEAGIDNMLDILDFTNFTPNSAAFLQQFLPQLKLWILASPLPQPLKEEIVANTWGLFYLTVANFDPNKTHDAKIAFNATGLQGNNTNMQGNATDAVETCPNEHYNKTVIQENPVYLSCGTVSRLRELMSKVIENVKAYLTTTRGITTSTTFVTTLDPTTTTLATTSNTILPTTSTSTTTPEPTTTSTSTATTTSTSTTTTTTTLAPTTTEDPGNWPAWDFVPITKKYEGNYSNATWNSYGSLFDSVSSCLLLLEDTIFTVFYKNADIVDSKNMQTWNITTNGPWKPVTYNASSPVPSARGGVNCMPYNKTLIAYGGGNHTSANSDVWKFDPSTKSWAVLSPNNTATTPSPRLYAASTVIESSNPDKNVMVIFGGCGAFYWQDFSNATKFNDVHAYYPASNKWRTLSTNGNPFAPSPRAGSYMGHYHGKMYIFGGSNAYDQAFNDMFRFDLETKVWQSITYSGYMPEIAWGSYCTTDTGELVISGGTKRFNPLVITIFTSFFNFAHETWTNATTERNKPLSAMIFHQNKLYNKGGFFSPIRIMQL